MTTKAPARPGTRNIDLSVEVSASVEAVWKAISESEGLASWFSPIAAVEPGEGGSVTVAWPPGAEWTSRITAWRPGEHLRLVDELPEEAKAQGAEMAMDYHLEARDGSTLVRLVNSGLSAGEDWDEAVHMMTNGWRFFLWNLKHAVERHRGIPRTMISERPWVSGSREEVWDRLFCEDGLGEAPDGPGAAEKAAGAGLDAPGGPFRFVLDGGEVLEGTVVLSDRPWAFAGMVATLDNGVFHVEMEGSGDRWKLGVWLSAYGVEQTRCKEVGEGLKKTINRLLPA